MTETKICKKKLTEAGGGVCLLAFTAVLISAMGLAMEYLGSLGYNRYADVAQTYVFAANVYDYIFTYDKSIITFLISITAFFILLSYRRKKKVGVELPSFLIISSLACSVKPVTFLVYVLNRSEFMDLFRNAGDSRTFLAVMSVLVYVLPLFACFFLFICGLVLFVKLLSETFTAEVPYMKYEKPEETEDDKESVIISASENNKKEEIVPDFEFVNSNYAPVDKKKITENTVEDVLHDTNAEKKENKCPHCGADLKPDAKFCQSCGGKIF